MAALSPVILKTSFYLPNKTNQAKNIANLLYISNKPETIKEHDLDLDLEPERGSNLEDAEKHLQYAAERPGSHGVFDADNRTADLLQLKDELKNSDSIVYRMILSLREDEAQRINHYDRASFEETVKKSMPGIAEKMGIPESNLRWAAAFHEKEGHPHVQILAWETEPNRTVGRLSQQEMRDIKKEFVRNIYQKERERLYIEKNYLRDELRNGGRDAMLKARHDLKNEKIFVQKNIVRPGIGPNIEPEQEAELALKLERLVEIMPEHGRVALKYMPDDVKSEARGIADWILRQPGYQQSADRYCEIQKELASHYQKSSDKIDEAGQKAYEDIRDRVAQDVLRTAAVLQKSEQKHQMDVGVTARTALRAAWHSIEKERMKSEVQAQIAQRQYKKKVNQKQNMDKGERDER